jgi:phosphate-selective porin OprO/OprP
MKNMLKTLAAAVAGWVLAAGASVAQAAAPPTLEELDQKVKVLERKLEIADEEAQKKAKESPVVKAGRDGFAISSADKAFQLKLRGYIQGDGRFFLEDDDE